MMYLLDTNACIRHLRGAGTSTISRKIAAVEPSQILLCSVVKAELFFGAAQSNDRAANLAKLERFFAQFVSIPFDDSAASAYGDIRSDLTRRGLIIGPNDLMIAAIALANQVTLVTRNTREFERVSGLRIEDWEAES